MLTSINIQCNSKQMIYIKPIAMTGMTDGYEYHVSLINTYHNTVTLWATGHTLKKSLENLKTELLSLPELKTVLLSINTFLCYLK